MKKIKIGFGLCFGIILGLNIKNAYAIDNYAYLCKNETTSSEICSTVNLDKETAYNAAEEKEISLVSSGGKKYIQIENGNYNKLIVNGNVNLKLNGDVTVNYFENISKSKINLIGNGGLKMDYVVNSSVSKYNNDYIYLISNVFSGERAVLAELISLDNPTHHMRIATETPEKLIEKKASLYVIKESSQYGKELLATGYSDVPGEALLNSQDGTQWYSSGVGDTELKNTLLNSQLIKFYNTYVNRYSSVSSALINDLFDTNLNKGYDESGNVMLSSSKLNNVYDTKSVFVDGNNNLKTKIKVTLSKPISSEYSLKVEYLNNNTSLINKINEITKENVLSGALYNIYFVDKDNNKVDINQEFEIEFTYTNSGNLKENAIINLANKKVIIYPAKTSYNTVQTTMNSFGTIAVITNNSGYDKVVELLDNSITDEDTNNNNSETNDDNTTDEVLDTAPQTYDNILINILIVSLLVVFSIVIKIRINKINV